MKIIKQEALLLPTTCMDPFDIVEKIGRTCYKSEDQITEDSAKKFVSFLVAKKHHAMIEFGHVRMYIYGSQNVNAFMTILNSAFWAIDASEALQTAVLNIHMADTYVIGNMRAFYNLYDAYLNDKFAFTDNGFYETRNMFMHMLLGLATYYPEVYGELYKKSVEKFGPANDGDEYTGGNGEFEIVDQAEFEGDLADEKGAFATDEVKMRLIPHIVKFTTNRGVSHELVRHRPCSFAQESTRYCNYIKDKFGGELVVIEPMYDPQSPEYFDWLVHAEASERVYMRQIGRGVQPQAARGSLTNDLKTEIWVGAYEDQWQHMINLRYHGTTGAPHPQIKEAFGLVYQQLVDASEGRLK